MPDLNFAALAPVLLLGLAFVGYCLMQIVKHPVRHLPKWGWAVIVVLSVPLGGIIYLVVGRDSLQ